MSFLVTYVCMVFFKEGRKRLLIKIKTHGFLSVQCAPLNFELSINFDNNVAQQCRIQIGKRARRVEKQS